MYSKGVRAVAVLIAVVVIASAVARAEEPLRAGLIGLDTSHVIAFTKSLNDPKAEGPLAEVKVVAGFPGGSKDNPSSWDRVPKYTEQLREMGVTIYDSIPEMLKHVDVVLLESVDGRPHLEQVKPVIEAGKPVFIDKPMAVSLTDAMAIFRLAKEHNVPCFSGSSLRFASGFQAARSGEGPYGKVLGCMAFSPCKTEPHHPDLFWYGIHGVETLFTVMGPGCQTVTRVHQDGADVVVGAWADGRIGTFRGTREGRHGYGAFVWGTKGSGSAGSYEGYEPLLVEICKFFKTGKTPICEEETLEILAFMEAADESKQRGGCPVSLEDMFKRAEKVNAERK